MSKKANEELVLGKVEIPPSEEEVTMVETNEVESEIVDKGEVDVDEFITAGKAGATAGGLVTAYSSTDLHATTPTNAELDTALGATVLAKAGFIGIAFDSTDDLPYVIISDGTDWFHSAKFAKAA